MEIVLYKTEYKEAVIKLILSIQNQEFDIAIDLNDQPDLINIESFYQINRGNFWVAKENNKIIGCIALLDIDDNNGALRKMFVHKSYRGKQYGIGEALLQTVFKWAKEKTFRAIYLGTTEKFIAAQRFYEKNNFAEIDKWALPIKFPIMNVDVKFYEYIINLQ